jgi:hypothetical protein
VDLAFDDEGRSPAAAACGASPADVTGTVNYLASDAPLRSDLSLTGTASHPDALAIRQVRVAGVAATQATANDNFASWRVSIPLRTLLDLSEADEDGVTGTARLSVVSTDACGDEDEIVAPLEVRVDLTPDSDVDRLALKLANEDQLPTSGRAYLPADGSYPGLVEIRANADAAGASVTLDATSGDLAGVDGSGRVFLGGDGASDATAFVLFEADGAGLVQLTAASEGIVAAMTLRVHGAPSLLPAGGSLDAGTTVRVSVVTEGMLRDCEARPVTPGTFLVTSGAADLVAAPSAGQDLSGDGYVDIDVTALQGAASGATLSLTCEDVYRQWSAVTFAVR